MENEITSKMREDTSLYYRFSKARDFNVKKAEDMLRKHIAWRKEFQVDTILEDYKPPEVLEKYLPISVICCDKEGFPVIYHDVALDETGIMNSVKKTDILKYSIYQNEKLLQLMNEQSKKNVPVSTLKECNVFKHLRFHYRTCLLRIFMFGTPITSSVQIYNFEGMTFAKVTNKRSIEIFMMVVSMFYDNYPERIKFIFDINTSRYFPILFSFIKVLIPPTVIEKIKIFGKDGWQEALLEIIDGDNLPAFLGGKKTDPDGNPLCPSFVIHPQEVPKHYYLKKSEKNLSKSAGVKKLILYPFSKEKLIFEIKDPNSYLEWEFETKSRDIGFGLSFKENSESVNTPIELVPNQRIDTYYEPETRVYKCEKPGIYVISFDNSYSWIYSKEIHHRIRILPPDGM